MDAGNRELLIEGAKAFGIRLREERITLFDRYLKELLKWNQKINLTAIRTEKGIVLKHFLDSLSVYPYLPVHSSLLDLGSGAGFPGIPLKIVEPSFGMTLIDSVLKKVDFQRHIIRILGLKGIETIHGRVQEKEIPEKVEGRCDVVISRAFSDLKTFLLLSGPFLRNGGLAVAMKGEVNERERDVASTLEQSRYTLRRTVSFSLPFSSFKRTILLFEKQ
ncbi:MAG: 16S rRNA (guanine(527)-N(7))-methyltransferase RsmG [Deltaproteobacteria bacterium RBG_13_52_11b]|nr:MAG: 16S rRNA (guanine(527)-N(7))-methyltransferase RsmG [Deltaproteobacteria bacterium RBG_13_52_11b]